MIEASFPILGAAFVVLVVLPGFALVAKLVLAAIERTAGVLQGLGVRYVVLVSASAVPLAWCLSAGLAQVLGGDSTTSCVFEHDVAPLCLEPGFFSLVLAAWCIGATVLGAGAEAFAPRRSTSDAARDVERRLARLIEAHPRLAALRGRTLVTDAPHVALETRGLRSPRVVLGAAFVRGLSEAQLAGALTHELEHVMARDPLRYGTIAAALAVNPIGRFLLEPHARRWVAAREARCDRDAVVRGAAPLDLAETVVRAARPERCAVALGAHDTASLSLRVNLLVAFAERAPRADAPARSPLPWATLLLVITLVLPHTTSTHALDVLHFTAERALAALIR
ncbi:hypothetical protein L6R52_43035 [Myxococcota bacterium]|nr:hypothetical protein [Myxococcota bacterium]